MCFPAIGAAVVGKAAAAGMSSLSLGLIGGSVVSSIASPVVSYVGQRQQAKAQAKFQAQAAAAERQRFMQEQTAMNIRRAQELKAAGEEMFDISEKTKRATDTAGMKARAQGMAGLNVDAIIDEQYALSGGLQNRITQQLAMGETAATLGFEQAQFVTSQRQIALAKPIQRPSLALSGLQALSGGVQAYAAGRQIGATYED